jgi:hypothetical protein
MDFLLECVGFPPDQDQERLVALARQAGERAPWRGATGEHLRVALGHGLELRVDRERGARHWTALPYFESTRRTRVALERVQALPDSTADALLEGWAHPPLPGGEGDGQSLDAWRLSMILTDARRLGVDLSPGAVLALSMAGFALNVDDVWRVDVADGQAVRPSSVRPLGRNEEPGGCVEITARVRSARDLANPLTERSVRLLELELPGKPLEVFVSPWQLEQDGLVLPGQGDWLAGVFLLTGRLAGGLASPAARLGRAFG